jgi:huntingtin-interacting protein 1-related protein
LKNVPALGDEVTTFKALITFHKVIKDGHPAVLRDAIGELRWLDALVRGVQHLSAKGSVCMTDFIL